MIYQIYFRSLRSKLPNEDHLTAVNALLRYEDIKTGLNTLIPIFSLLGRNDRLKK